MILVLVLCFCKLAIVYSAELSNIDDLKLELVQVLFRHGARTPLQDALTVYRAKQNPHYEPWETGQLTNFGKQQEYYFGKFLRNRYDNFLSSAYKSNDVYAYSSDLPRTKMSLELVLAGLYPANLLRRSDAFSSWIPLPYSYAPIKFDILLATVFNEKYLKLYKEVESDEYRKKIARYSEFHAFVSKNTKGDVKGSIAKSIPKIFDVLISHEYMNLTLPDWYTPKVRQKFIEIMEVNWDSLAATTELKKLGIGALMKAFVENMNLNGTSTKPKKIYLYSGFDVNISFFTRLHNIPDFHYAFCGSAIILEKLRDSKNRVYVRAYFWDGLGKLEALKLGNRLNCPIDDYLEIVKPFIPTESEIDDFIGNWNSTEIKNLFFKSNNNKFVSLNI